MLFDLVVLGTDPAGLAAATRAAEMGLRVAIVNDPVNFKALGHDGKAFPSMEYFSGSVKFTTAKSLEIAISDETQHLESRRFLLACGNRPKRPAHILFDGQRILDSDEALRQDQVPQSVLIVGAGEHGLRCASRLLKQGARVSLVDQSSPSRAQRRGQCLWKEISEVRCPVHWGATVLGVESRHSTVTVFYENGSIESSGGVVFAVGRIGCTEHLNLPRPDLLLDETHRVWCNESGQTSFSHIYAVGSVVGFPRFSGSPVQEAEHVLRHLFAEESFPKPSGFSQNGKVAKSA